MPVYEYECETHGRFEARRPMAAFREPCPCPACGAAAARTTALPRVAALSPGDRLAHQTNERARHEPKSTRSHGPNCGCCAGAGKGRSKALHRPDGAKTFPSKRPWMISH